MKQKKQSSLTRILSYAGGHKNLTILGCVLSALSAVLGLAPYLCVWLVARSILAAWPSLDGAGDLGRFGWMAVWFAIGSILLYFAALMSTHIAAFRTARNIRRAAMTHVLKLPLGFFTGNQSGRLRKLIDDNAGLTEDLLAHKLPDLAATAVTPIAAIVVLFLFDWRMGLLCLLTMVLALLSMCLMMGGKNAGFFHRYQQEIERMSGEAVEYVRGIPVVKMFQQTVYSFKAFYAAIQDYSDLASQYAMSCRTGQTCFLTFINGAFALLIPAALLIASGGDVRTALVNFIFYALFAPACGQMINRIMYMSEAVMEADEAIGRLDEILSQQPMEEPKVTKRPTGDAVAFDHVTFTYPGADEPVLKDVSFECRAGEVTAIIGRTGCGKSSILKLIPRLYDATVGHVYVDDMNVKQYKLNELRDLIGYIPQKNVLFSGDVASNLRFGDQDSSEEQWRQAAYIACADEFIEQKPDGYHAEIAQGGTNLSGGQRQRMAIARAVVKKPEIYLFDDSFSALDVKTDKTLRMRLRESMGDSTMLIVAQRVGSILDADRILVMEDGQIVGRGKHRELLHTCPLYREIAELQLGEEEVKHELECV